MTQVQRFERPEPGRLCHVAGKPPIVVPGGHLRLACAIIDRGRALGLTWAGFEASRSRRSRSRYLHFRDAGGRLWVLRVSDHRRVIGACTHRERPHFDLVSLDGRAGLDAAFQFLGRVARGEAAWADPTLPIPE